MQRGGTSATARREFEPHGNFWDFAEAICSDYRQGLRI